MVLKLDTVWAFVMTAQLRGWIEPDVLKDNGNREGAGWAEMDGWEDRQRGRQRGWMSSSHQDVR